ncbi:hypothetical protein [Novosphingobium sp. M1R2S20]|uniref:Secreted protein with PEP-CTERM sorting signal n=1 Tax=Novosphingobium rhizovicinum TaxID=3228928 RepID=A0ABV3RBJ4_9SPHN
MIGKIVGALIGAKAAKRPGGVGEQGGALLGVAAAAVTRRFGLPGIAAAALGGYALKRYNRKREAGRRPRA